MWSASKNREDDILEFLNIQLLQKMQDWEECNHVKSEEQRVHQKQMLQQQKMIMLLVSNLVGGK